ncbi:MAG: family 78 glycoside hydrolase catalytic domain, partial [Caldilineaceae bacterium]
LVQWAPNGRRSESTRPHLLAEVDGSRNGANVVIDATGPAWLSMLSEAWQADAAPVHTAGILGPTELLDLRALPAGWMSPGFDDGDWHSAEVVNVEPQPRYQSRTIPLLADVVMPYTVLDSGFLSPGYEIVQIVPGDSPTLEIDASAYATATIEIPVEAASGEPVTAELDGIPILWQVASQIRPDIVEGEAPLDQGRHTLAFESVPAYGIPVAVGPSPVVQPEGLMQQGIHAGRRLLLADPVSDPDAVTATPSHIEKAQIFRFAGQPSYLVLDLGRVVHGRIVATVSGPAGTVVDIGWDERLYDGTLRPLPHPGTLHPYWDQVDSWVLDGEARSITTIDARAGRYVLIAAWGNSVVLDELLVLEERYPVEARGWFQSSNHRLDAIWQLGVNTAYPSMQDAYADPWRERGQWWGDAYVADHINQVAFGDSLLLRRGLRAIADAADDNGNLPAYAPNSDSARMVDYGMLWVQSLHDYVERTDDIALPCELYPALQRYIAYLETYRRQDTGLLDIPNGHWSESALVDWAGTPSRHGQSSVLNALYVKTLRDAASIARRLNRGQDAEIWDERALVVQQAVNRELLLPSEHRYATSILDGAYVTSTTHAQVWPLAMDIVPEEEIDGVAKAALDGFRVEIFGMFWALEGLGNAGHIQDAVDLIEERYGVLLDRGATTLWEHWNSDQRYDAALSHAWGGGATWFLTTYVLGIQRTGPMTWTFQPAFAGVERVAGAIPLQSGEVTGRWVEDGCGMRTLEVTAPQDSAGTIVLGLEHAIRITENGQVIWHEGIPDGARMEDSSLQVPLAGGHAMFEIEVHCPKQ